MPKISKYELTIVVSPQVKAEKRKEVVAALKKQIADLRGKADKVDQWGLKDLAYPIAKQLSGWYACLKIALPAQAVDKLDKEIQRDEKILRHLIVVTGGSRRK